MRYFIAGLTTVFLGLISVAYWQDPWLWRRYVNFAFSVQNDGGLRPFEVVRGDGSYQLSPPKTTSIHQEALDLAVGYAKEFDSYALIVIHKGQLQLEWYAPGFDPNRLTESQSMHKTLMGLFVGIAIEDGYIGSVHDRVGEYVEEWRSDKRGDITIEQLLQMSSGLSQYPFSLNPFSGALKWLNSGDSVTPLLETPAAPWQPGSRYDYNNLNSELLGLIIERASGQRYAQYLEDRLWMPMGGDRAHVWLDSENGVAHTSCCLATPAMDWARFGMLLLGMGEVNGQRIVSKEWIDAMLKPSQAAYWYGYHIWLGYGDPPFPPGSGSTKPIASEPYVARDTVLTWGRGQQHVWVSHEADLVVVRLGPALGRNPIKPGFDVPKIPNLIVRGIKGPSEPPVEADAEVAASGI